MSLYDPVIHTFTTVATGGFSPRTASIGFYDSLAIEIVIVFFMVVSGVSFSVYYLLYTRRSLDTVLDRELAAYLLLLLGSICPVWATLISGGGYGGARGAALRDSVFSVTSVVTTTRFVTADFDRWDTASTTPLVILMFVGGGAGPRAA